jgi:hypothetical protein
MGQWLDHGPMATAPLAAELPQVAAQARVREQRAEGLAVRRVPAQRA